ncbi:hypothetical protein VPNG_01842 [Cytospora leucostoma]|uniref:BZIP domain-containing protein n=1 Tax=Cytospora leucostoma TaxID=1230097 RepID=A0A423XII2_9PEZI|nr:hypothetical protein VPNG_01842 [Cytospora leucostoma]
MAEHQASPGERPSFATFWRNNQNESTAKELTFVQSVPGQPSKKSSEKSPEVEQIAKNKRRAQVRKAQVQHRQRKADYVQQLEANIAGIQGAIADAERQCQVLRGENEAIRALIAGPARLGQHASVPGIELTQVAPYVPVLDGELSIQGLDLDPAFLMDYYSMGTNMEDHMNTTATFDLFEISPQTSSGTNSSLYGSPQFIASRVNSSPYPSIPETATDQPQQTLNLFLAR